MSALRGARAARAAVAGTAALLSLGSAAPRGGVGPQQGDPLATLLYPNFPNPFPTATSASTCVWFDLAANGPVGLEVFTLRGAHVRTLIPARDVPGRLGPGRYGRSSNGVSGCDARFSWDGTGDDGRLAPAGVYLIRLRAGGADAVRKALFQGR